MPSAFLLVLPVLTTLILAACGGTLQGPGGPEGAAGAFPPTDVTVRTLEATPVPQTSEYVATIRSLRSITVQPDVEGVVRAGTRQLRRSRHPGADAPANRRKPAAGDGHGRRIPAGGA